MRLTFPHEFFMVDFTGISIAKTKNRKLQQERKPPNLAKKVPGTSSEEIKELTSVCSMKIPA